MKTPLELLDDLSKTLTVPAAEYVPAIPDAWIIIDQLRAALRTAHLTKDAGELPPLPAKRRQQFCTKCGTGGQALTQEPHPACLNEKCGYLCFASDCDYNDEDMRAYALAARTSPAAPSQEAGDDAARDVLAERRRQISAEGWTPEHDDEHGAGSMAFAAAAYAVHANAGGPRLSTLLWNRTGWGRDWWKPKDARRDLIRAGALIRAEIERIDRAAMAATTSTPGEQA